MGSGNKDWMDRLLGYWWGKFVVAALFAGIGVYLYGKLMALETGAVESVSVWRPIALLYNAGGFWLAMSLPIVGALAFAAWGAFDMIKRTKERAEAPALRQ